MGTEATKEGLFVCELCGELQVSGAVPEYDYYSGRDVLSCMILCIKCGYQNYVYMEADK